ncbi:hypothetical protein V8D89_003251 [Ganoderma adspersum]
MHGTLLPLNRSDFRRTRKVQLRDLRSTEIAERGQRAERERRAKQKHIEQLGVICVHGREVIAVTVGRSAQERISGLGKAVLSFHSHTKKEERKRISRLAKERLKAVKSEEEEAYMKLIDTAKDTHITHLLKQTDAYLDSLIQAVVEQQWDQEGRALLRECSMRRDVNAKAIRDEAQSMQLIASKSLRCTKQNNCHPFTPRARYGLAMADKNTPWRLVCNAQDTCERPLHSHSPVAMTVRAKPHPRLPEH